MDGIAPLDVAVVGLDVLWTAEAMNAVAAGLDGTVVEEFLALAPAIERLTADHPAVVVVGPDLAVAELDDLGTLGASRPEVAVLTVVDDPAGLDAARVAQVLGRPPLTTGDLPGLVTAVDLALLDRRAKAASAPPSAAGGGAPDPAGVDQRLVLVTGAKGGVGRTTLAINLAAALAARGEGEVALVDACTPMGDVALLLGLPAPTGHDIDDFSIDPGNVLHISNRHEQTGLLVVTPPDRRGADHDGVEELTPAQLLALLVAVGVHARTVVVDIPLPLVCTAGLGPLSALTLLVVTPSTASLKNALIARDLLGPSTPVSVVVNERGPHHGPYDIGVVERTLRAPVLADLPYDEDVARASEGGTPSGRTPPRSKVTKRIGQLAEAVAERLPSPASGG